MNIPHQELEKILHLAPNPKPPSGLKERLISEASSSTSRAAEAPSPRQAVRESPRRWWPVVAPWLVSLACAAVFTLQQRVLRDLRHSIETLSTRPPALPAHDLSPAPLGTQSSESSAGEQAEIERLRKLALGLGSELVQLEQWRADNEKLRQRLATPDISGLSAEEAEAVGEAREKALSVACINNLKQIGLSVRTWALDENDAQPPNLLCMSNELSTPKVLVCPAETSRQIAPNWSGFSPANCSYEYLVTSGTNLPETEPTRVQSRCPVHGHIGMCDGSVQANTAKNHPDWFVKRSGKLYFEPPPNSNGP